MMQTFKNDNSFFTIVMPIRTPVKFWDIYKWADADGNAKFRFIRDFEVEQDRLTLKDVKEIYPGVKTIGVVTNPWARIAWTYAKTIDPPVGWPTIADVQNNIEGLDFTSFDAFVTSSLTCKLLKSKYHPTTPQSCWVEDDEGTVDFLLRAETVNEDFKPIQDYFCTDKPLGIENFEFDYKPYYTEKTKEIVQNLAAYDIEKYGYSF